MMEQNYSDNSRSRVFHDEQFRLSNVNPPKKVRKDIFCESIAKENDDRAFLLYNILTEEECAFKHLLNFTYFKVIILFPKPKREDLRKYLDQKIIEQTLKLSFNQQMYLFFISRLLFISFNFLDERLPVGKNKGRDQTHFARTK